MLALYVDEPSCFPRLRSALPPEQPVRLMEDWDQVEIEAPSVDCTVVQVEWLPNSPVFPKLSDFKSCHPTHPVILVTRWDPDNARCLKDLFVDEVVWSREVERDLPEAIERVCTRDFNYVHSLAVPLEEAEYLPLGLRTALAYACRNPRPVCSVNRLAAATGHNRRLLWQEWKQTIGASSSLRLQDFLHWILLLRALGRKTSSQTWPAVAEQVGVHPHTLWRLAKHLTGRTPSQLAAAGQTELAVTFRTEMLEILLNENGLDKV